MDQTEKLKDNESLQTALLTVYDQLCAKEMSIEEFQEKEEVDVLETEIEKKKEELKKSRTGKLWLLYMEMISVLRKFLMAERTGKWMLHLESLHVRAMLPYFAAAGHNLYTKSAHVYLSQMRNLQNDKPAVHAFFCKGYHVVRRCDRFWGGISTDLAIEQILMRSIKSSGGLTRGRGLGVAQRTLWLLSMPACCEVNEAMQTLTGTHYESSDQHAEASETRKARDYRDISVIEEFLRDRNPFSLDDCSLRNIETGVTADTRVNADEANGIGERILQKMANQLVMEYTFKRKDQVVPLNAKRGSKMGTEQDDSMEQIDPQLMFQRLVIAGEGHLTESSDLFQHELASLPPSMFDNNGYPREATKSTLADALWNKDKCLVDSLESNEQYRYVLDGGSLIQRIPWVVGTTFSRLCQIYVDHVKSHFPDAAVVFDSYPEYPTTKDITHMRRAKGQKSTDINFTENMPCRIKKDQFLANQRNKQRFLNLLSTKLREQHIEVLQADDDADLLIAQTALNSAKDRPTIVVGEDTDVLVLLLYHIQNYHQKVIYHSAKHSQGKACRIWDINKTAKLHGETTCRLLPFVHAVTGCDTTSRLFGLGKAVALKKVATNEYFRSQGEIFMSNGRTKDDIIKAGEEAISCLYGGVPLEGLQILRWRKFTSKVAQNRGTPVAVHTLPPTPDAASLHSLRVYLQCQVWTGETALNPVEFGWFVENGKYLPKKMTLPPAPDSLLQIIRCNCKTSCDTRRCTCRRSGLDCYIVCGECRGICSNSSPSVQEEDDDDIDPLNADTQEV